MESVAGHAKQISPMAREKGLIFLLFVAIVAGFILAARNPRDLQKPSTDRLLDRIDPNVADVSVLALLPSLGQQRAEEIVAFRQREKQRHPEAVVFEQLEDMERVRGIGKAMAQNLGPYLIFPTTRPTK
jgi:hypothetical protein